MYYRFIPAVCLISLLLHGATVSSASKRLVYNSLSAQSNETGPVGALYTSSVSTLSDQLTLKWGLPANGTTIYFQLVCKCSGWVALGLGYGMGPATDMMIGRISDSGLVEVGDYWSTEEKRPNKDVSLGGTADIFGVSGSRSDGITTISFARNLTTVDKYDNPIVEGWNNIILAFQTDEYDLEDHGSNQAIGRIQIVRGEAGESNVAGGFTVGRVLHALVMIIGWFGFMLLGAIMGRYGRKHPKWSGSWFKIHQFVQTGSVFIVVGGAALAYLFAPVHFATPYHGQIGFILVVCAVIQGAGGYLRPAVAVRKENRSPLRAWWEGFHRFFGAILLLCACGTVWAGLNYLRASTIVLAFPIIFALALIGFVVYMEMQQRKNATQQAASQPTANQPSSSSTVVATTKTDDKMIPLDQVVL